MMKRKIVLSLIACLLAAACLAGCSSDSEAASSLAASSAASSEGSSVSEAAAVEASAGEKSGFDLDGVFETLKESNPISNPFEIAAMNIEFDFMLAPEDVAAYKGVRSNDNGDAGLVLVIQPAEGKAETICEALETYKQDQVAFYGNYAEFAQAQANVENAVIVGRDEVVVMMIASNEATADLSAAVNDALGL